MRSKWKPSKVFYGWWIVGACFFIALYLGGIVYYGFTAIFEPIANEFGWSYTQISFAASIRGLETALFAPLAGILVDRWGTRRQMFSGLIITGLGLMLLSRTTSLGMFYTAFVLIALGVSATAGTVISTAVANWFRRRIGLATGIVISGFGFGGLLIPVIVRLIDMFSWQTTMVFLALGMWVIVLPLSLLVRNKPEQYGYLPDGEVSGTVTSDKSSAPAQTVEMDIGVKQALKSRVFWHISLALMCRALIVSAVVTHVMPYLSSIGISRATSSLVAAAIPLLSTGGRIGFGWLGDKLDKRWVMAGVFVMISLGLLSFGYTPTGGAWLLVPFLILFGISYGSTTVLRGALVQEYFGRGRFGTILGFMVGIMHLGTIAGPPLAGWVFDNWGSYQAIWFVFAGVAVVALIIVATTPQVGAITKLADEPTAFENTV